MYKICLEVGEAEIIEKKSRSIAQIAPVSSEEEALAYIASIRKKHWNATHNCFAYVVGGIERCSDDGEPAKTAGRPMLDVLLSHNIKDVCVVVTRYFGGTLLGTGGLVRAYQGAAIEGLKAAKILEVTEGVFIRLVFSYDMLGKLRYIIEREEIIISDIEYTDKVSMSLIMKLNQEKNFIDIVNDESSGTATVKENKKISFVMDKAKALIIQ